MCFNNIINEITNFGFFNLYIYFCHISIILTVFNCLKAENQFYQNLNSIELF